MKRIIIYLLVFTSNLVISQEYKLGKVTIEELKETEHKLEKDANACKIFSKAKTFMVYNNDRGFELVTEVENKIKIYKTDGLGLANFSIKYYNYASDKENVFFSDAVTYNLVNGKIEKTKLKSEGEFTERVNKFNMVKKITMPNVKVGSIIEYKYTIKSPFLSQVKDWYFQDLIPIDFCSYQVKFPEYYSYNTFTKGTLNVKNTKSEVSTNITIRSKDRQSTNGGRTVSTEFSQTQVSVKENVTDYEVVNVPSIKEEAFVKNIDNYVSGVTHELSSIKYPDEPYKLISNSWEEVVKNINSSDDFGGELKKSGFFEKQINKIIEGKTTPEDKMEAVFSFLKQNVKWNNYYGIYTDEGVKNAFLNKSGSVSDINLLLTIFLRHVGLKANPIILSSVSNGIPLYPSRSAFNYVICGVEVNDNLVLLDATDKYAHPNVIPSRAINWIGRMLYEDGKSVEVDLQPKVVSKDNVIMNYELSPEGTATGSVKRQITNYNALSYRSNNGQSTNESMVEKKEDIFGNIEVSDYAVENVNDLGLPVVESFNFIDNKHIDVIDDKIYFSPLLIYGLNSNPFKLEERSYPIEFLYPNIDKYIVNITIPEGYVVDALPQNHSIVYGDKLLAHKYFLTNNERVLSLVVQEEINVLIMDSMHYKDLKKYYESIIEKQKEKIVISKKKL